MKRLSLRKWKLRRYCSVCNLDEWTTAEEIIFGSLKDLCDCKRVFRIADSKGNTDWKIISFLWKQSDRHTAFAKKQANEQFIENGFELFSRDRQQYGMLLCPHPDCDGKLVFKMSMAYDRVECNCICKACKVQLGLKSGTPTVALVKT